MSNAPLLLTNFITEDTQLWLSFKQGKEGAFSMIFKKYYNDLYFYGLKLTNDEALVKDTIQDFFALLWLRREQLGEVENVKAYLIISFRRELVRGSNAIRKLIEKKQLFKDTLSEFELSKEDLIVQNDFQNENILQLKKALNKLKATQREIIYLRFYSGFDDKEISQILNIKYQSVRNKIHRALNALRKHLKK